MPRTKPCTPPSARAATAGRSPRSRLPPPLSPRLGSLGPMTEPTTAPDLAVLGGGELGPAVVKAVIPAAGLGTRFLPATKATPKEMLPVVDRPAIQYVVEEAVAAGLDD